VASYDGATLKVFSTGHSTANVCLWRLHGCQLDFIHVSATGVAEIADSTNLNVCPHTAVHFVYSPGTLLRSHQSIYAALAPSCGLLGTATSTPLHSMNPTKSHWTGGQRSLNQVKTLSYH
jgi:hypothetical protein